jgi:hypothetical protein
MLKTCRFLLVALVVPWALAQDNSQKPQLSKDPLTADQIAIYRVVLEDYVKGSDGALNLANKTNPAGSDLGDADCLRKAGLEIASKSARVAHLLDPTVALSPKMVLVDPERQRATVDKNDPGNVIRKGETTEDQVGKAVDEAFRTGLFTFSEIVFDKEHRHAGLSYSFVCGMLCGHGNTVILEKIKDKWKISKRCAGWIS